MKKRLICLLLCLVMVLSMVLTSCSDKSEEEAKDDISDAASETAMTLSMWVVCEEEVSADNAAAVTKAINAITNSKFKTQLAINFLTEDVYREKLEEAIIAFEASDFNQNRDEEEEVETEEGETGEQETVTDETVTNDLGMTVIKYPELLANQVDIIYIAGEDMYIDFIEKEWLADLDTELSVSSKKLKEYISGTLLAAAQVEGTTYAIPNNRTIGEYTYMLLNQELMKKYNQHAYWEQGMIDGFYNDNLYSFLNLVDLFEEDVIPVDSSYEDCLNLLAHFWYIDNDYSVKLDKFSVFGYHYDNMQDLNRGSVALGFESLFANDEFAEDFLKLNEFRMKDYFRLENDTRSQVAVKFTTGDATILSEGKYVEDGVTYYPVVVGYPTATSNDIYGNMFGVCAYSLSVSRSMEIVTYLNTNPEFRNLLQYGVKDLHYTVSNSADGNVVIKRNPNEAFKYQMNIYATGNTFIAYPDPKENMAPDIWESGKEQNRSSLVDPLLGFDLKDFTLEDAVEDDSISLDDDGYNISYTTGHSKELVSENSNVLKQWFASCDAQGKGMYMLRTTSSEEVYQRNVYYIYNTNVEKSVIVKVDDDAIMVEKVDPKTGNTSMEQVGVTVTLEYVNGTEDSDTAGYELTVVSVDCNKNGQVQMKYSVEGGAAADFITTENDGRIAIDFMKTEKYDISVYELTKATVLKNPTLIDWVLNTEDNNKGLNNYLMTNETDLGNGKKEVVYVVYRSKLVQDTTLTVQPTGDASNLVLDFRYDAPGDPLGDDALDYLFTYVSIIADSDVEISCKPSLTYYETIAPEKEGDDPTQVLRYVTETFKKTDVKDPSYDRLGNLDTDLVKFMKKVNDAVSEIIEKHYNEIRSTYLSKLERAKTDKERKAAWDTASSNLEKLVEDLQNLFSVDENALNAATRLNFPQIYTDLNSATYKGVFITDDRTNKPKEEDLAQFRRNVRALASNVIVEYNVTRPDGKFDPEFDDIRPEDFVYFDSPYMIYYTWATKYGYWPKSSNQGTTTPEAEATA